MIAQHKADIPKIPLYLVFLVAIGVIFSGLGSFAILDNNEGLYAEIAREMLVSVDWHAWIIPHLNGLPYMEKPPLLYWLTALTFALLGESEWTARLVPALSAMFCVGALLWFGKALGRPLAGRLAALMFVTGLGMMAMSHVLMFDMLLTALLTAALMCAYRFDQSQDRRYMRWSCFWLALAMMSKGLVALVLFGLVIGVYVLVRVFASRSLAPVRQCLDLPAWGLFLLIVLPWHAALSLTEPLFAWFYFVNEHVLRFLGQREPHDYYAGTWWYYLPRMVIYLFPWSFLWPCLLFKKYPLFPRSDQLELFLCLAWFLPLGFFSVCSAKANYYLLVVMPFVAFHLALAIEERGFLNGMGRALPGLCIAAVTLGLAGLLFLRVEKLQFGSDTMFFFGELNTSQFVLSALSTTALLALIAALLAWRMPKAGILSYLALPLSNMAIFLIAIQSVESSTSMRATAHYLRTEQADHQVYLYRDFEQQSSLALYLQQPLPILDLRSNDLYWGDRLRPHNPIHVRITRFIELLAEQKIALVVPDRHLDDFQTSALFACFIGRKRVGESTVFFN